MEGSARVRGAEILDELAERLAFERMLARLYRALDARLGRSDVVDGGPSHHELAQIDASLLGRCEALDDAITELTPGPEAREAGSPRLVGTCEFGAVLDDPRSGVAQCIEALLVTELLDSDAWAALVERLEAHGLLELARAFERTSKEEQRAQLSTVRRWTLAARTHRDGRRTSGRAAARLSPGVVFWQRGLR